MSTIAGVSSLNSLIAYNQAYKGSAAPSASSPATSPNASSAATSTTSGTNTANTDPQTAIQAGAQTQQQSTASILSSLAPASTAVDGAATAPSSLYSNISTYAVLMAVEQANGYAASHGQSPHLPLGTASQAAASGQAAQYASELALANITT